MVDYGNLSYPELYKHCDDRGMGEVDITSDDVNELLEHRVPRAISAHAKDPAGMDRIYRRIDILGQRFGMTRLRWPDILLEDMPDVYASPGSESWKPEKLPDFVESLRVG